MIQRKKKPQCQQYLIYSNFMPVTLTNDLFKLLQHALVKTKS